MLTRKSLHRYLHRLPKDSVRRQEAKGSQNRTEKQRVEPEADDLPLLGAPENDVMPLAPTEGEEYCEKKEVTQEHIHIAVQPLIVQDSSRHEMTEYVDVDSENMSQATKINTLGSPLQIPDSILRPQVEVHDTENIPMSSEETLSTMEVEHASPSQESDQAPLLQEEDQVPPESETELRHQPPPALAARMKPGIHGRGVRVGHDGNPTQGKTPLKDVQDQAQQHSAEYREKLQDKQDKEDTRNHQQELQNANTDVPEYVLEGMIRNMALGASVFPL
ncbi:hypothetical protein EDD21DRAFT_66778 [Dissophora ornata]|nr:hypothetical protein EDD21DRAFT_66778 [Dissophora ornata]